MLFILYVSKHAWDKTTINLLVVLSREESGTGCFGMNEAGGTDDVLLEVEEVEEVVVDEAGDFSTCDSLVVFCCGLLFSAVLVVIVEEKEGGLKG